MHPWLPFFPIPFHFRFSFPVRLGARNSTHYRSLLLLLAKKESSWQSESIPLRNYSRNRCMQHTHRDMGAGREAWRSRRKSCSFPFPSSFPSGADSIFPLPLAHKERFHLPLQEEVEGKDRHESCLLLGLFPPFAFFEFSFGTLYDKFEMTLG